VEDARGRIEPVKTAMAEFARDMIAYTIPGEDDEEE
jgi:DNA-directed RNA polymerase subunit K/omega